MPIGNPGLTAEIPGQNITDPGMAHFAGTGPHGKLCKDCKFKGYLKTVTSEKTGDDYSVRHEGCAEYKRLTGRHGQPINGENHSCKYFQQRENRR